jgi:hypothetical protein
MWFLVALMIVAAFVIAGQAYQRYRGTQRKKLVQDHPAIVRVLLSLEPEPLDDLFKLYRTQFGAGAARYARHTYRKWKTREVHPSRKTFWRLAFHLPSVMSFDLKCEVLRALRREYCGKNNYELSVRFDDWKAAMEPLIAGLIEKSYTAELPNEVEQTLTWLAGNDMQIAKALLSSSEAQETRDAVASLQSEFDGMELLLAESRGNPRIVHTLELPLGTITLNIERS